MQVGTNVCFLCGKPGHMKSECPQLTTNNDKPQGNNYQPKQPAQARVYSLTPANNEEEAPSTDVVTGTIPLFGRLACVLFNFGATHSFVSSTYVKLCNMNTKPLEQNIRVTNPVGNTVTCVKFVENCPIVIGGRTLPTKLAVFGMLGFDTILRIDWLSKYEANIDCRKKEVYLDFGILRSSNFVDLSYELLHLSSPLYRQERVLGMSLTLIWLT
jgi:hypothetical protein